MLGEHTIDRFNTSQLKALIMLHSEKALDEAYHHNKPEEMKGLNSNSLNMLTSALTLHKIAVSAIMTPSTQMYCLYLDSKLNKETRKSILDSGFSRIPICYSEQNKFVVGIILTKKLISIEPGNETIAELFVQKLLSIKVPLYVHKCESYFKRLQRRSLSHGDRLQRR